MDNHLDTDVLIVGAGPTGLTLACVLAHAGVRCRVLERQDDFFLASRGRALHPRSLEVLDDLGVIDRILARGTTQFRVLLYDRGRLHLDLDLGGLPRRTAGAPYDRLVLTPQWAVEQTLGARLSELGVTIDRGVTLLDLRQDSDRVVATIEQKGQKSELTATWLVGCDGAHSTVRKSQGIAFEGTTQEEHFYIADVEIAGLEPRDGGHMFFNPDPTGVFLATGPLPHIKSWQLLLDIRPDAHGQVAEPTLELLQELLAKRTRRTDIRISNATWLSHFRINRRLAASYRKGRVFLAGDAAHVHSPAGGQGTNTGIQDAYNLGWKLALVSQGRAAETLLDTYNEERRPIAAAVLQGSNQGHTALFSQHPLLAFLRERVIFPAMRHPAVRGKLLQRMAQLGLHYRDSPLAAQDTPPAHRGHFLQRAAHFLQPAVQAGERAPDADGHDVASAKPTRLFDCFRGPHFTLLLFSGRAPSAANSAALHTLAEKAVARAGKDLHLVHVLHPDASHDPAPTGAFRFLDDQREAHRFYGVQLATAILIRPDGYVGFRSETLRPELLLDYLARLFIALPAAEPAR